jgi:hypothetical protein
MSACAQIADCSSLLDCAANCSSDTCINACYEQYSGGASALNAVLDCMTNSCSTDCG